LTPAATAKLTATVVLPTPPFWAMSAIFFTSAPIQVCNFTRMHLITVAIVQMCTPSQGRFTRRKSRDVIRKPARALYFTAEVVHMCTYAPPGPERPPARCRPQAADRRCEPAGKMIGRWQPGPARRGRGDVSREVSAVGGVVVRPDRAEPQVGGGVIVTGWQGQGRFGSAVRATIAD
jgi:hypothetical protein